MRTTNHTPHHTTPHNTELKNINVPTRPGARDVDTRAGCRWDRCDGHQCPCWAWHDYSGPRPDGPRNPPLNDAHYFLVRSYPRAATNSWQNVFIKTRKVNRTACKQLYGVSAGWTSQQRSLCREQRGEEGWVSVATKFKQLGGKRWVKKRDSNCTVAKRLDSDHRFMDF